MFFEDKQLYQQTTGEPLSKKADRLGVARIGRAGADVTVVAIGRYVPVALALAAELAPEIDIEVIDPRTLFPLDDETIISSARKTRRVIVIESGVRRFGVSSEIADAHIRGRLRLPRCSGGAPGSARSDRSVQPRSGGCCVADQGRSGASGSGSAQGLGRRWLPRFTFPIWG